MSLRAANIEVSLQRLSILRIEHPQANPLTLACTLRVGETLPSGLTITAEVHTSRNVAAETTPLASSSVTVAADATTFDVSFSSAQLNQTVTPDSTRALWLVVYGVGNADQLYTLAAADLLLGWHAISTLTADPPATSILVEKGGVAWAVGRQYVSGTMVTVGTTAYVCTTDNTSAAGDQPGVGAEWESFWVVLSGGGGATNLTTTVSPTGVTIVSSTGTDATIPAADGTNAGLMLPAQVTKLAGIATGATANATDAQLRDRSTHSGTQAISTIVNLQTTLDGKAAATHTHSIADVTGLQTALDGKAATSHNHSASQISDSTVAGRALLTAADATAQRTALGLGSLATQSGTFSGTSSGTNTGDQTISLTGDVTGSGTGSVAATIANDAITTVKINNAAVTNAKLANASAMTIKANLTGSSAPPSDADLVDVASSLPVFGAAQRGMVPAFGAGTNGRILTPVGFTDTLAFGTLTASDPLVISQTWNNAAVGFNAIEVNITNTANAAGSYFINCRSNAGANDRFRVTVGGAIWASGDLALFGGGAGIGSSGSSLGLYLSDGVARVAIGGTAGSPNFFRESDNSCSQRNGTAAQALRIHDTYGSATDYHRASIATVRTSLSALSGASITSTGLIPAGAIVVGVTAKVLTAITGASSWQLGTAADPDRFAASGGIAIGSTTDNRNWTSGALECFLSATDIVLTANGSNFTGGSIYISVQYIRGEAD